MLPVLLKKNMKEITTTETPILTVQQVRLIDVFLIAPFCIYVSTYKSLPTSVRIGMLVLGISTFIYNGNNYLKNLNN